MADSLDREEIAMRFGAKKRATLLEAVRVL
jgi:hypothetical protein